MHWLYLIAALGSFALAIWSSLPSWAVGLAILASFGFFILWMFGMLSQKISSNSRDEIHILTPDELRKIREQAATRKTEASRTEAGSNQPK